MEKNLTLIRNPFQLVRDMYPFLLHIQRLIGAEHIGFAIVPLCQSLPPKQKA